MVAASGSLHYHSLSMPCKLCALLMFMIVAHDPICSMQSLLKPTAIPLLCLMTSHCTAFCFVRPEMHTLMNEDAVPGLK